MGGERFDCPSLSFDLCEHVRQGLERQHVLGQLGQQRQVAGLQAAAAQDAESAVLRPLRRAPGQGRRGQGVLRRTGRPVRVLLRRHVTVPVVRGAVRSRVRSEGGVRRRPSVRELVRHDVMT